MSISSQPLLALRFLHDVDINCSTLGAVWTPLQIANVQKDIEGLDVDDDDDMMVLDGYEELPDEAKAKIRQSLKDGHVADEDWKGDPEKNRPGQKGINLWPKKEENQG